MAFRGLLGVQGVFPVSAPADAGFTLNRLTGIWVDGGPSGGGFTLNRLMGVWVDGATLVVEVEEVGGGSATGVILPRRRQLEIPIEDLEDKNVLYALLAVMAIQEIYYD